VAIFHEEGLARLIHQQRKGCEIPKLAAAIQLNTIEAKIDGGLNVPLIVMNAVISWWEWPVLRSLATKRTSKTPTFASRRRAPTGNDFVFAAPAIISIPACESKFYVSRQVRHTITLANPFLGQWNEHDQS
jgi:hypothetical protein